MIKKCLLVFGIAILMTGIVSSISWSGGTSTTGYTNLSQLDDTAISSPSNGEVLTWSSSVMKWVNAAAGAASKWLFGDSPYWYNDSTTVYFNESQLNRTIDLRATGAGNSSWNQTLASSLFVPYSGAFSNVNLGNYDLTADTININQLWSLDSDDISTYGSFIPNYDAYSLGNSSNQWVHGYFSENVSANSFLTPYTTIEDGGSILMTNTNKEYFMRVLNPSINTATTNKLLWFKGISTTNALDSSLTGITGEVTTRPSSVRTSAVTGVTASATGEATGTGKVNSIVGGNFLARYGGETATSAMTGGSFRTFTTAGTSGYIGSVVSAKMTMELKDSVVPEASLLEVRSAKGNEIRNLFGIYLQQQSVGTTQNWQIFSEGGNSHLGGDNDTIDLGVTNPLQILNDGRNGVIRMSGDGSLLIRNESGDGWGTIEYGQAITHTRIDNSSNVLEYFADGNILQQTDDFGECAIIRQYTNTSQPLITTLNRTEVDVNGTEYIVYYNVTTYPYTYNESVLDVECYRAKVGQALARFNASMSISPENNIAFRENISISYIKDEDSSSYSGYEGGVFTIYG